MEYILQGILRIPCQAWSFGRSIFCLWPELYPAWNYEHAGSFRRWSSQGTDGQITSSDLGGLGSGSGKWCSWWRTNKNLSGWIGQWKKAYSMGIKRSLEVYEPCTAQYRWLVVLLAGAQPSHTGYGICHGYDWIPLARCHYGHCPGCGGEGRVYLCGSQGCQAEANVGQGYSSNACTMVCLGSGGSPYDRLRLLHAGLCHGLFTYRSHAATGFISLVPGGTGFTGRLSSPNISEPVP